MVQGEGVAGEVGEVGEVAGVIVVLVVLVQWGRRPRALLWPFLGYDWRRIRIEWTLLVMRRHGRNWYVGFLLIYFIGLFGEDAYASAYASVCVCM